MDNTYKISDTFGIIFGPDNIYTDVSNTLKGAKRYATIHGYKKVGIRFNSGYHASVAAVKVNNKWVFNKWVQAKIERLKNEKNK
jgi:hypothetical protein